MDRHLRLLRASALALAATLAATLVAAGAMPSAAAAQPTYSCNPLPAGVNETKLLGFFAVPLAFSAIEQPQRVPTGLTTIVLELANVPEADRAIRRTQCFAANKEQNANLSAYLPRPRILVGLPYGMQLEGTWLPPVTVGDATPNLVQGALSWTGRLGTFAGNGLRLQLRAHATRGWVRGAITCNAQSLRPADSLAPCFGSVPSRDRYSPDMTGGEVLLAVDGPGYGYYVGSGYTSLDPSLRVDFTNGRGNRDTSRVTAPRLGQVPLLFGGSLRFTQTLSLLGQYYIVLDQTSLFRVGVGWRPFGRRP
ncbi:MAG: hypothetical protein ACK6DK_02955 [Gemmatimonadota bacterium]